MGILNRTPDSFFDQGRYYDFDAFLAKAEQLVAEGADFLDVGGVKAGPGPEVDEAEELERVDPGHRGAARPLRRAALGRHLAGLGAPRAALRRRRGRGQRHQRLRRPRLPRRGRRGRRVGGGHPHPARPAGARPRARSTTSRWSTRCAAFLRDRAEQAEAAGIPRERIMVDAGLDLGKTEPQSLELLRAHDRLAGARAGRCSCRRRTSGSSATWSAPTWTTAARPATPPTRSASRSAAGSCGPTTCAAPAAPPT